MSVLVHIYDDTSDVPQPAGPIAIDIRDGATDAETTSEIRRLFVEPSRPARIEWNGGPINGPGWRVLYEERVA